jgi:PAS domain S-box-containing protein
VETALENRNSVRSAEMPVEELQVLYSLTDRLYRASTLGEILDAGLDAIVSVLGDRGSILLFDQAGVMRFVGWRGLSDSYRLRLEGHTPWTPDDFNPDPIFVSDIAETTEADWVKQAISAEGIRGLAFIPLVARRRVIGKFMTYYPVAHHFSEAERNLATNIAHQLGFSLERLRADEARRAAEGDLRESEQRFRLMSEQAPVMIWMSDAAGHCTHLNRLQRSFWGIATDDLSNFDWQSTMHPEDAARIGQEMGGALMRREPVTIEGRYRDANGGYRVLRTDARPRFSLSGEFLGMIGVNVDISKEHETQETLRLLLAELNHRVKNTLAIVQGLAHQTFKDGNATSAARQSFQGRLLALAGAHSLLTQSNWEDASLQDLAMGALRSQGISGDRFAIRGPHVALPAKHALSLALVLHELGTNAAKYGALSADAGRVEIESSLEPPDRLFLSWREYGGPPVVPPSQTGFGTRLIRESLTRDLDADVTLDYPADGFVFTVRMPLLPAGSGNAAPP